MELRSVGLLLWLGLVLLLLEWGGLVVLLLEHSQVGFSLMYLWADPLVHLLVSHRLALDRQCLEDQWPSRGSLLVGFQLLVHQVLLQGHAQWDLVHLLHLLDHLACLCLLPQACLVVQSVTDRPRWLVQGDFRGVPSSLALLFRLHRRHPMHSLLQHLLLGLLRSHLVHILCLEIHH